MLISGVVSFYFVISLGMVFLNKIVLTTDFRFPLFLTWAQLVIALGLCWVGGKLGQQYVTPLNFAVLGSESRLRHHWIAVGAKIPSRRKPNSLLLFLALRAPLALRSC